METFEWYISTKTFDYLSIKILRIRFENYNLNCKESLKIDAELPICVFAYFLSKGRQFVTI